MLTSYKVSNMEKILRSHFVFFVLSTTRDRRVIYNLLSELFVLLILYLNSAIVIYIEVNNVKYSYTFK